MTDRPAPYRCRTCGERSISWAAAERHADSRRHWRIELILSPTPIPRRTP